MTPFAKRALSILGLSLFVAILGFQAAPAIPNMVLYYKFDETVGFTTFDSSGNGFNGNWVSGNAGSAIAASAAADCAPVARVPGNTRSVVFTRPTANLDFGSYVTTPSAAAFTFTTPFSAMAWVKPVEIVNGQNQNNTAAIVQKWDYGTAQLSGWAFNRDLGGRIRFITGSATVTDQLVGNQLLAPAVWHHVAVVWDGTTKYIYFDGVIDVSGPSTIVPAPSGAALHVGKDDSNRNYIGNVDEVRLFDGPLTAAQVLQCYNGVNAPLNLVATAGPDEALLSWTASPTAQSYDIYRSTTQGGPYGFLANVLAGAPNTYLDLTALQGPTYYYVVKSRVGTLASAYSNEAFCTPTVNQILINPRAISVAEAGGTATFTVTLRTRPNNTSVTINLSSAPGGLINLNGPGGTPAATAQLIFLASQPLTQTVTVTGIERYVQGPNLTASINFAVNSTDPLYAVPPNANPRPVTCTIIQDVPGLVINPSAGLATTNGGPAITFTVGLATQTVPANGAILTFSVSDPNIATVAPPGPITLSAPNAPITITVTPLTVDTTTTYIAPYTININSSTSTDPGYAALGITRVPIFTETSTPPLEHLWKCGLMGVDSLLPLGLLALWRRRRQARRSR